MADEELKKAFQELQFKANETRTRINHGEAVRATNMQNAKISEAARNTLDKYSPETHIYQGVGKIFLLSTKDKELERHEKEAAEFREKAAQISKQREYLEKSISEAEQNLRELIQARRS